MSSLPTVLHIGTEKTGTKSLQTLLARNRDTLRERGVVYTQSLGERNNRDLATYAIREGVFDDNALVEHGIRDEDARSAFRADVERRLAEELDRVREGAHLAVFSSEHLQSRLTTDAEIHLLKAMLERQGLEVVRVVVYLRHQPELVWSLYSTALRYGATSPPPTAPGKRAMHVCDHRRTLLTWGSVFGADRIVPRLFRQDCFVGGSLLTDFADTVGFDLDGLVMPERRNESLTHAGQVLLREVNRRLLATGEALTPAQRHRLITLVQPRFSGAGPPIPPELDDACEEMFGEVNEWVRLRYFPNLEQLFDPTQRTDGGLEDLRLADALDLIADLLPYVADVRARGRPGRRRGGRLPAGRDALRDQAADEALEYPAVEERSPVARRRRGGERRAD